MNIIRKLYFRKCNSENTFLKVQLKNIFRKVLFRKYNSENIKKSSPSVYRIWSIIVR